MGKKPRRSRLFHLAAASLILVFLLAACGPAGDSGTTPAISGEEEAFTLEQLAEYDGQDGRKAYIAVDGVVYDVTDIPQWPGGIHQSRFSAGKDYSEGIRGQSPHGTSMLSRARRVGVLVD